MLRYMQCKHILSHATCTKSAGDNAVPVENASTKKQDLAASSRLLPVKLLTMDGPVTAMLVGAQHLNQVLVHA